MGRYHIIPVVFSSVIPFFHISSALTSRSKRVSKASFLPSAVSLSAFSAKRACFSSARVVRVSTFVIFPFLAPLEPRQRIPLTGANGGAKVNAADIHSLQLDAFPQPRFFSVRAAGDTGPARDMVPRSLDGNGVVLPYVKAAAPFPSWELGAGSSIFS